MRTSNIKVLNSISKVTDYCFNAFLTKMFHVKHHTSPKLEAMPQKIKLAKELQTMFKPVNQYYSWNHKTKIYGTSKCLDNPLNIIKNAYNMKVDTSLYQKNRNYFSNLYKSMRSADIPHSDILSIWGNPYIGTVTKWNELSYQRKQNILKDYPGTDGIANRINEAKQALTFELAAADYDTKQFIQDFVIVGLSVWAEKQFKLPNTLMAPVYATRMERAFAYIQPDFFRKKGAETAKKRTIPTAESKIEWHKKMMKEKKWKPCHGEWRGYYEGTVPGSNKIYRFKPTFEKNEYEVYKYESGKGKHCGIFRTEGDGAFKVLGDKYAKNTFRGKW